MIAAAVHSDPGLLLELVAVLGIGALFAALSLRLRQSVLVGFLATGVILGPGALGVVRDVDAFSFMGEIGIALLLFSVGLDLPLARVRRVGGIAFRAGIVQVVLTAVVGTAVALAFGLQPAAAAIVGLALSMSSTAVVLRVLTDRSETDSVHGMVATGVLILQDVAVVVMLLVIPHLNESPMDALSELGGAFLRLILLIVALYVLEMIIVRHIFNMVPFVAGREILALASLVCSLGAIGGAMWLGLSPALGGFIAGFIMADAGYATQVRSELSVLRMALVAAFFAYIGMLADISWMGSHLMQIVAASVSVIVGKTLLTWVALRIARVPAIASRIGAVALAQVGEFSFVVLAAGAAVGLVSDEMQRLAVATTLVTLAVSPTLIAWVSRGAYSHALSAGDGIDALDTDVEHAIGDHVILVGFGPSGRAVASAVGNAGIAVTMIELNPNAHAGSEGELPIGARVVFGDATRPEILMRAGIATARMLVVTVPEPTAIRTIISQSSQISPHTPIVARGRYHLYVEELISAGADQVVDEEVVTGRALAHAVLTRLGHEARGSDEHLVAVSAEGHGRPESGPYPATGD